MYASPPSNFLYQGARSLRNWVESAAAKIQDMNAQARKVAQQLLTEEPLELDEVKMPTLEAWKKLSYVGPFARRKEQVAVLDGLIPKYHEAKRKDDTLGELRILAEMHCQIFSHLTQKPKSDRRAAVLHLAMVVTGLLQEDADLFGPVAEVLGIG
jgi:hypothetical protein